MAKRLKTWKSRQRLKKQTETREAKRGPSKSWIDMVSQESREHIGIVAELRMQSWMQGVDWWHTPSEGLRNEFQAWLYKSMGGSKNVPDFIVAEGRGGFSGLYMEYKKTGTKLFKADGSPYADVKEQWEFLLRMKAKINVKIALVAGPAAAVATIKEYLTLPPNDTPTA